MENLSIFYTYAYLREDGRPYYVGKGKGYRAFNKNRKGLNPPKDKSRIIFLKQNLTEEEAFRHEIYMISIFGRKDLETGILHNRTNGGEGSSGVVISKESKEKMSKAQTGKTLSKKTREKMSKSRQGENHPFYNKSHSIESKEKMSKAQTGKTLSKKTREKMSKSKTGKNNSYSFWWKITFERGNQIVICSLRNWSMENNYTFSNLHQISLGKRKRHKDIVAVEKLLRNI